MGRRAVAGAASPEVLAPFVAAAGYLTRPDPTCPAHRVRHTGKLARSIPVDLALLGATGETGYWTRAVQRGVEVAGRLAPDPEHGALIYLPGRLDRRNCSNSVIDSGECTDALARLLLHPRAAGLPAAQRITLAEAVIGNAGTYLSPTVMDKEIPNQRLWGAMGLATACRLWAHGDWRAAVAGAVTRSLEEQRADGSWGYQPQALRQGAHPGAADLTVYYHSRCLAFLFHILDCLPSLDGAAIDGALRRGLDFLAAVITPDGRKPLALEGKRWFWDGPAEAGSNAFDVYALVRGWQRYGESHWLDLARRSWGQLVMHQLPDGSILAGGEPGRRDFVCPTFHTADLAWTAQVIPWLPGPAPGWPATHPASADPPAAGARRGLGHLPEKERRRPGVSTPPAGESRLLHFPQAGVVRLESPAAVALVRTLKGPRNSQFGGAIGGGTLLYAGDRVSGRNRLRLERESPEVEGSFTLYPQTPDRRAALWRFRRSDPPGREGRQWLFVARLLLAQGRPVAAAARLWRGYLRPLRQALSDPATTHWALQPEVEVDPSAAWLRLIARPARPDGTVPSWAAGIIATREITLAGAHVRVVDCLAREESSPPGVSAGPRIVYLLPAAAQDVRVECPGPVTRRPPAGRRLELRPSAPRFTLRLAFAV